MNRAFESEFDGLVITDTRAHSFGLPVELCDFYWSDEIAVRDR